MFTLNELFTKQSELEILLSLVLGLVYYTVLQKKLYRKVAIQIWSSKVLDENGNKLLPDIF